MRRLSLSSSRGKTRFAISVADYDVGLEEMKRKSDLTLLDVAGIITRFVDGTCGPYEWDDFMSPPIEDPAILKIREEGERVEIDFPARHDREWCSPDGGQALLAIAERIRQSVQQVGVDNGATRRV